jgi:ribosomal protein L11 methyltransferase
MGLKPMYLWRKFAEPAWSSEREELLQARTGGGLTVIERPGRSRVRLEVSCRNLRAANSLLQEFGGQIERLPRDWLARFSRREKARRLRIGKRLVIVNVEGAASTRPSGNILVIPAGAAFGTGEHATTAMSLRLLEEATRGWKNNWRMLDAGTGTGILALAGRCFGAQDVLALDHDPAAIATAKENARANAIRGVRFVLGDAVRRLGQRKFDVIAANLFSVLLISALPFWKKRLKKNGLMVLSGVLHEQESGLLGALRRNTFEIAEVKRRGKWIAVLCRSGL